jgi:hypothetical protein
LPAAQEAVDAAPQVGLGARLERRIYVASRSERPASAGAPAAAMLIVEGMRAACEGVMEE